MRGLLMSCGLLGACTGLGPAPAAPLVPTPCHLRGVDAETRCATVPVPLRADDPASPTLGLRVVVVPAVRPDPSPDPIYFLAGGPGQAATEVIALALPGLARSQRQRDLIFVDIRGTGASAPLDCAPPADADSLAALFDDTPSDADLAACLDALPHPPAAFTTDAIADDLLRVADALGHGDINLVGVSYGTRLALTVMRRHPGRVRAAVLDGVAPPPLPLFSSFATDAQSALDAWFADCAADAACAAAVPDPAAALAGALARAESPAPLAHPRTGALSTVTVGRAGLAGAVRNALYLPGLAAHLPVALQQAADGDLTPLVAMSAAMGEGAAESMSTGLLLSVVCAEDLPRVDIEAHRAAVAGTFLGDGLLTSMVSICARWPAGPPAPGHADPVVSDIPTLLFSGARDPVTPPRHAADAAATLSRSRSLTVPGAAHGTLGLGCAPTLVESFFDTADPSALDPSCLSTLRPPAPSVGPLGSRP
jgi:pimeloyl-ACP methyl ester carboxylesterase